MSCVFCQIIAGEIAVPRVYEDDRVIVFEDRAPLAPVHCLIIPKKHISSLLERDEQDNELLGHMFYVANTVAKESYVLDGYKTVINAGKEGGQEVFHLHLHLMGGKPLTMPNVS